MITSDDRCHPVILSLFFFACWLLVSVVFYNLRRDLWHQNSTVGRLHALLHDDSCVGLRCLEDPILSGREKLPFILGEPMHLKRNHPENVPQNRHWNQFDFTPTRPNIASPRAIDASVLEAFVRFSGARMLGAFVMLQFVAAQVRSGR